MIPLATFRLSDLHRARLNELGRRWGGPVKPLSMSDVIRELIDREFRSKPEKEKPCTPSS